MSRLGRRNLDYDYHYTGRRSAWDTSTFIGFEANNDDEEDDNADGYSGVTLGRRPSASVSVIGYRDIDLRSPRTAPRFSREQHRDRDSHSYSHRATMAKPSLSPTATGRCLSPHSTDRDRANETLKQRLCLGHRPTTSRTTPFAAYHPGQRARSLSLSRFPGGGGGGGGGYSSSPEDDDNQGVYDGPEYTPPSPPGSYHYYRHGRLSQSSPRVGAVGPWPDSAASSRSSSRPVSRSPSLDRDLDGEVLGYGRGYRLPEASFLPGDDDELRFRLGGGALPSMARVSVSRAKRRSKSYERYYRRAGEGMSPVAGGRAVSEYRDARPQYSQVHALILTWSFHDLRTEDYTTPPAADYVSLEEETARLRHTLEGYGYTVHEFLIPMHRPVESLRAKLKQFCCYAADDTLLIIYYHGHGALDDENELVFSSHDHPDNAEWSKAAAAELYAGLLSGDACAIHGRRDIYLDLLKKYERYRPVATVKWDSIRSTVLSAPCDVLLVLDCCAAGGANLRHVNWQPPPGTEQYTKHLFAACGFESSTRDDMTAAMCEVLEEWVPPPPPPPPPPAAVTAQVDSGTAAGGGGGGEKAAGSPGGGTAGQYLTTKRLHQLVEDKLQKRSVGSQPIFKQLLPHDPEQYITLPNLRGRELRMGVRRGRRGYVLA